MESPNAADRAMPSLPGTTPITRQSSLLSSEHILSQRVSRALEVRTDTPAMSAALTALEQFSHHSNAHVNITNRHSHTQVQAAISTTTTTTTTGVKIIDAKNVRSMIESDALHQALLFQNEMRGLLGVVSRMRSELSAVSEFANAVRTVIDTDACVSVVNNNTAPDDDTVAVAVASEEHKDDNDGDAESNLADLLAEAFHRRDVCHTRYNNITLFLERFQISPREDQLLTHYNFNEFLTDAASQQAQSQQLEQMRLESDAQQQGVDGYAFLDALEHIRRVRSELQKTFFEGSTAAKDASLSSSSSDLQQQLGATSAVRMMETLSGKQERAQDRLYHFLQNHLQLNKRAAHPHFHPQTSNVPTSSQQQTSHYPAAPPPNPAVYDDETLDEQLSHPFIRRAFHLLREVPSFHTHCCELLSQSSREKVTRRFLLALTSGYAGAAPIEMRAHDPTNYVGDMLAFCFRAYSVELDLAKGLLLVNDDDRVDEEDGSGNDDLTKDHTNDGDPNPAAPAEMVAQAMGGVIRPLKSRVLQVIANLSRRPDDEMETSAASLERREQRQHDLERNIHPETSHLDDSDDELDLGYNTTDPEHLSSELFRQRIESLYEICGILLFYQSAIQKADAKLTLLLTTSGNASGVVTTAMISASVTPSSLITTLRECLQEASESYAASMRVYGTMLDTFATEARDQEPNFSTVECESPANRHSAASLAQTLLLKISDARQTSPGFLPGMLTLPSTQSSSSSDILDAAETVLSLEFVCNTLLGAALAFCDTLSDIETLRNCVTTSTKAGCSSDCASHWEGVLKDTEISTLGVLCETETSRLLYGCGLGALSDALSSYRTTREANPKITLSMASYPGLSQGDLEQGIGQFYTSLYSPQEVPSFDMLKDLAVRNECRSRTTVSVWEAYRRLYEAIMEEVTGDHSDYTNVESFLGHDPDQVRTLLSI